MKKAAVVIFTVLFGFLLFLGAAKPCAARQAGYIFDVQGDAKLKTVDGKTFRLKRDEHLLHAIEEGDIIRVTKGKVVIAVLKENVGYEIRDNSEGIAKDGRIVAIRGKVSELEGLHAPGRVATGSMGGFVVRSVRPCIRAISPVSTTIIELTPELAWENKCPGDKTVTVRIMAGDTVLFSTQSENNSLTVPENVLAFGHKYRWVVDSGKAKNVSSGFFSVPSESEVKKIIKKIDQFREHRQDLSFRLSYVFFLIDNDLNEMAKEQVKALRSDFPGNRYITQVEESIR